MTDRVIFLDIDGVLTTRKTGYATGDPDCVGNLNILVYLTGARIVVSSTWRADERIAEILREWGVKGEVIDTTPFLSERSQDGVWSAKPRGQEIEAWLEEHPDVEKFVILDDDNDMGHLGYALVRTDFQVGLMPTDVERAVDLLK